MKNKTKKYDKSHCLPKEKVDDGSELRQDIVTGDWVVIATGRAKKITDYKLERNKEVTDPSVCVFCDPDASCQEPDVLIYENSSGDWTLRVFPNKFPAFSRGKRPKSKEEGPYFSMTGSGYHEVIITRDNEKQIALMEDMEVAEIFDAYQERYIDLMNKKSVNYIGIFHNHGKEAGASISHPHSQLVAIPVISPYVNLELRGSEAYYRNNKKCVYCGIAEYESEKNERVIFENSEFIAFCPFSSRAAFEVWVMPKKHKPYFERTTYEDKIKLAEVFKKAIRSIYETLDDPAYNFYIHTSPCDGKDYPHFHWHIEILPRTATWAGFELQTGIEVSTMQPEKAAKYLRESI